MNLKAGDILTGTVEDSNELGEIFIYSGVNSPDGYGILIGWNRFNNIIEKTSGNGNCQWGGDVRESTEYEVRFLFNKIMIQETI